MPKYRIGLTQHVWEQATVYVDAENEEAAETAAIEKVNSGDVDWHFLEANDPSEIVSIDLVNDTPAAV